MTTFAAAFAAMDDEPPVNTTIADEIELMLIDADALASKAQFEEAMQLAESASDMAYLVGDIVQAVKASCDAHRYNAQFKSLDLFWKGYAEFCRVVRQQWLVDRSELEVRLANAELEMLAEFGHRLGKDLDMRSA